MIGYRVIANRVYYTVRPLLPLGLRLGLRRRLGNSRRKTYADCWPIDESAGATPPGWPGWPEGKRFALVLTHDVEGSKGLSLVSKLMDLEAKHGFRSSFNMVPEGEYRVPEALRRELEEADFELGVHGLRHDGMLYSSKAAFARSAHRINDYIHEWKASGFRSPVMQHRLGWLHKLDILYDCSTFDTDPFEPEPDGVGTIFPFWVSGPEGSGYVEIPYTLVQDFTLFVVLQEPNIDIWKRKLDWIAERGGMALLNTHPDYMSFGGKVERDEYPVSHYEEFLTYAREKYGDAFWPARPGELARFYTSNVPLCSRNTRKKVCMLAYSSYAGDGRVRQYAESLASRGDLVDVIALGEADAASPQRRVRGAAEYPILGPGRDGQPQWQQAWRMIRFLLKSSLFLTRRHDRIQYDLIHVHNNPDFLVFAAWYAKLTGAKLILDIRDSVPEILEAGSGARRPGLYLRFRKGVERASASFADHIVVASRLSYERLTARSFPKEKCSVFADHIDPNIFYRHSRTRDDDHVVLMFPGGCQKCHGPDVAIEALLHIRRKAPNTELHLYGGGGMERDLRLLAERLGLNGAVKFCPSLPLERMPDVIANADFGVVPKRAGACAGEARRTKVMEFMSQGVPVVISPTKIDKYYFDERVVRFVPSEDPKTLADAILELIERKDLREALIEAGIDYVKRENRDVRAEDYLDLVDSLTVEAL